jgi:hypothetical protein
MRTMLNVARCHAAKERRSTTPPSIALALQTATLSCLEVIAGISRCGLLRADRQRGSRGSAGRWNSRGHPGGSTVQARSLRFPDPCSKPPVVGCVLASLAESQPWRISAGAGCCSTYGPQNTVTCQVSRSTPVVLEASCSTSPFNLHSRRIFLAIALPEL